MHTLLPLSYDYNALEPFISRETLEFHHGKHVQAYVDNLNKLIVNTEFETASLEEIVAHSMGTIYNNAAQIWNHNVYFDIMSPNASETLPSEELSLAIKNIWWDMNIFIEEFSARAVANFGSGWTWLVKNQHGTLEIINTSNADTLLGNPEYSVLIACDVWEHSYYIDCRNARAKYLQNFFKVLDWEKVSERFL